MPEVLILSGAPGAGKSTVARALADRYDRVAHIDVDTLRHFITPTGYIAPGRPGFERQQRLGVRNACGLALNFLEERFAVIIDDTVTSASELAAYRDALAVAGVVAHYVRLMPSLAVCQSRNLARAEGRVRPGRVEEVWRALQDAGDIGGASIDSSELSAFETADRVQALTTSGASLLSRATGARDQA
jgi:predicted kinase